MRQRFARQYRLRCGSRNSARNNASAYIAMPSRKLGIVILANRGDLHPNEVGRRIMLELARLTRAGNA
jgi:hypothetical protein